MALSDHTFKASLKERGYSYTDKTGDGNAVTFMFGFVGPSPGYLSKEDIYVFLRNSDKSSAGYGEYTLLPKPYVFPAENLITLATAPEAPKDGLPNIRIRRIVDKNAPYADTNSDDIFKKHIINNSFLLQLYAQHEVLDGYIGGSGGYDSDVNMNNFKLFNLAPGFEPHHSVNFGQLSTLSKKVDGLIEVDMKPLVKRAEDAAASAESSEQTTIANKDDFELTYLGARSDFPVWGRVGALMLYTGDAAERGSYQYVGGVSSTNGWQRVSVNPVQDAGVEQTNITLVTETNQFGLQHKSLSCILCINGVQQAPNTFTYINDRQGIQTDIYWGSGDIIHITNFYSVRFAIGVTFKGKGSADSIYQKVDMKSGDAWFVTADGTIPPSSGKEGNLTWKKGDTAIYTEHDGWARGDLRGPEGPAGVNGTNGKDGAAGKSAYQTWLDGGNKGTEKDFLLSLKGVDGVNGTNGAKGDEGASAYQSWLNEGNTGTEADFIRSITGPAGPAGQDGADGKDGLGLLMQGDADIAKMNALAVGSVKASFAWHMTQEGTISNPSIVGPSSPVKVGDVIVYAAEVKFVNLGSLKGLQGKAGLSPYVESDGTWYADTNNDGKYEPTGVNATGPIGPRGPTGNVGEPGKNGADGVSVTSVSINPQGELIVSLNGTPHNLGVVKGADGADGKDAATPKVQYSATTDGNDFSDAPGQLVSRIRFDMGANGSWGSPALVRGARGDKGEEGAQGPMGPAGPAATFGVATHTGAALSIDNSTQPYKCRFNIPVGASSSKEVMVFRNGVAQAKGDWTVVGQQITLTSSLTFEASEQITVLAVMA